MTSELELARTDNWLPVLSRVADLAVKIAGTDLVPKAYRNDPETVAAIILRGREIGLPPMTALASCFSVNGRVGLYAEAQRALVLAAGHELWFEDASGQSVTACGRRKGTSTVHKVMWSGDMARAAGLNSGPHKAYPRAMLKARASAELIRDVFPDVVGGFPSVEELDAPTATVPEDTAAPPVTSRVKRATPIRTPPPELSTAPPAWEEAKASVALDGDTQVVGEPPPPEPDALGFGVIPPVTVKQLARLQIVARDLGLGRDERLLAASTELGRAVGSFTHLDIAEASTLIDTWQSILEGNPPHET